MRSLFQKVVEVVCRSLNKSRELCCLFLLDSLRVEIDVVFLQGRSAMLVEETLDGEIPNVKADERAKQRLAANEKRRRHEVGE